ncbi:alanine racemase, N-terminal domain protein [Clostridioides difficile CD160]|nr:alanine racemase, N-terminal domain protein [Clostridioides difficile CD160]
MGSIKDNLSEIKSKIDKAAKKVNRQSEEITLLAVTKTVDVDLVNEAMNEGITSAGENKPQELARKYDIIGDKLNWHLIGTLQTNKVKYIIDKVCMIHSLDRIALCEEIQKRAEQINREIDCLVQVNISKEESKHGLDKEEVVGFVKEVSEKYKNIKIKGLMTMAPFVEDENEIRGVFKGLKDLSTRIKELNIPNVGMDVLSMGMSHDYEIAIEEGATIVRVGTSIFGERNYNKK